MNLLEVGDLTVSFPTADGLVRAVRGVSFTIEQGRTLGVVGESGSGKSVTALTMLGLSKGADVSGSVAFDGQDLLAMDDRQLRAIRGAQIAMVFQDPLTSLHPLYRVGWQIEEMIRAHQDVSREAARRRAVELLGLVGIPEPRRRVDDYPHQLSGGMRQRAMLAMAVALEPRLLIADEPTTALDATVQAQVLDLMMRLRTQIGMALIVITHDLGVVAELADQVLVMYAGRIVEVGDRRTVYYRTHNPYTLGLLRSLPGAAATRDRLRPIPGQPPSLLRLPGGCPFHPRCEYAMDRCSVEEPPLRDVEGGPGHRSACWLPPDAVGLGGTAVLRRAEASSTAHRSGHHSGAVPT